MKLVPHPFVARDIDGIVDTTGGDVAAALKRLDEIDAPHPLQVIDSTERWPDGSCAMAVATR